jgi:hypothetical protein
VIFVPLAPDTLNTCLGSMTVDIERSKYRGQEIDLKINQLSVFPAIIKRH